jgi:MFS transporter, DHA2 family, multidrug resistance protein
LLLMVRAGTLVVLFPLTTWVTSHANWDMRWVAAGGIAMAGIATWVQANVMTTHSTFAALIPMQILGGVGYAFIWVPLSVVLFRTVPQAEIPSALALTRLVQQIGASAGSAYAATLLDRGYNNALSGLAGSINLGNNAIAAYVAAHGSQAIAQLTAMVSSEAQNLAATEATRFFAIATIFAAVLPFLLERYRGQTPVSALPPPPLPSPPVPILREKVSTNGSRVTSA